MKCYLSWKYNSKGRPLKKVLPVRADVYVEDKNKKAYALEIEFPMELHLIGIDIFSDIIIIRGIQQKSEKFAGYYQEWYLMKINKE
ncbi:MAG: hypothetical protein AB1567_12390 [bacterium]